jgi:SAM-dependent methyltransferase
MTGLLHVIRFNWPRYALVLLVVVAAASAPAPVPARYLLRCAAAVAAAWVAVGLLVTWWAYDHSPLYRWRWLLYLLPPAPPARYAVVSTGLDEVSPALQHLFPHARPELLDLYDPRLTREGSVRRARALVPPPPGARPAHPDRLPVPDRALDAVFLVFAAHELRTPGPREALFAEIARTLRPGGRLLLVEHFRDAANIAAYGPGAWHFYPRREWLRLCRGASLTPVREVRMTPFIHALACRR